MKRYFYLNESLDDLDQVEEELEASGLAKSQIHVFSKDDSGVEGHGHLHNTRSVFKTNVAHGMIIGAWVGLGIAALVLLVTYFSSWTVAYTWIPFIFLAIISLGFSTWVGGLYGIQSPHKDLKKFVSRLNEGKHLFFVDVDSKQQGGLDSVIKAHPGMQLAGKGESTPRWVVMAQQRIKTFTTEVFP